MGIVVAFIIALVMAFLLSPYKKKDSIVPLIILFVVLFMAALATELWVAPFGPTIGDIAWIPVLIIVLITGLLFLAPPPRIAKPNDSAENSKTAINIFIWIALVVLLITVAAGFYKKGLLF